MSSGTLSVTGAAYLGDGSNALATFDQTGGTVIISDQVGTGELSIGVATQSNPGVYNLTGGTLSSSNVYVGGSSGGSYGKGVLNISGGSLSTGTVEIYSGSTLTLSGGTLSASGLNFNGVPSAMQWTGGTLNLTSNATFDSEASSTTTGAAFGSALSMGPNQTLDISGNETLSASNGGTFSLTVGSGGTNIVTGSLSVGTGGTLNITGGTVSAASLSAQIGPVYVSSGTVSVGSLALDGSPMTVNGGTVVTGAVSFALGASITQNSGNFSATGINLGSGGLLKLSGGTMSSGSLTLVSGGAEEFIYNGGSHNFNQISVAGGTLTGSAFTLGASESLSVTGGLISPAILSVAPGSSATQSGGTLSVSALDVSGSYTYTSGTFSPSAVYILSGGEISQTSLNNTTTIDIQPGGVLAGSNLTNNSLITGAGTVTTSIGNYATIQPSGGVLTFTQAVNNSGTVTLPSGGEGLFDNFTYNPGTVSLAGGTFNNNSESLNNVGTIAGYGVLQTGTLTNNATVALAGQTSIFSAVTNASTGLIHLSGNSLTVFNNALTNNGKFTIDAGASGSVYGSYTGTGSIVDNGALYLNASSVAGPISGSGDLTIGSASSGPAVVQLNPGSGTSVQDALSIIPNSTFDIANNAFVIDYGSGPDPVATIRQEIIEGYNNGLWTGAGIISSDARSNSSYGVGYADSADPNNPAGLSSGTIEIMYTLLGDANLDGKVNGTDFTLMAASFNQSGKSWDQGDFNYDGDVNGSDFVLLADNFNQFASQSAVSAADLAALDAFAAANGFSLTSVPEPAGAMVIAMAACGVLQRRSRTRKASTSA
jgi:hypothetical protein